MIAEVISVNEVPAGFARWPQVDLKFRLVNAQQRQSEDKTPTLDIQNQAGYDAMGHPTSSESTVVIGKDADFYTEMEKLGELKEKGLLTEEEFQKEKQRLLEARDKQAN